MRDEKKHFHEIDVSMIKNKIVIIDIDGTLVCPSGSDPSDAVHEKVRELEGHNTVYAFSNNFNGTRSRAVADKLGLAYIESPFRKPNPKIINYIKKGEQKLVMIGDKYLTDHLFAHFAKGEFIHVKRYACKSDHFGSRVASLIDDTAYVLAKLLRIV